MRRRFESHQLINVSIIVLTLVVLGLAGHFAWQGYERLRAVQQLVLLNRLSDRIIVATGMYALERGMTAATLGMPYSDRRLLRDEILAVRKRADAVWGSALGTAARVEHLAALLAPVNDRFYALRDARARVDGYLDGHGSAVDSGRWLDTSTRFIVEAARAREQALVSIDAAHEIAKHNARLKQPLWLVSEYAGRERAQFALFVSAQRPVPEAVLAELGAYRGLVNYNLDNLRAIAAFPDTDPRIVSAIHAMEKRFVEDYEPVRRLVYTGAATGRYDLSGESWVRLSTQAIDAVHDAIAVASQVIEERADAMRQASLRAMGLNILMTAIVLILAVLSVTRVVRTARTLFHEKELAEVTLHSIGDAVITTDANARIEHMNPIAEELTGWRLPEARGRPLDDVFRIINGITREPQMNPVERCLREEQIVGLQYNTVLIRRDGTELSIEDSAAPVRDRDGRIVGAVMVFFDCTHTRNMGHFLSYQATHDMLTGLVNRREFERRLNELLESARHGGREHVLLYLDLDRFKLVNDTCGHPAGDQLLRQLAPLLRKRLRETDTFARLGGDEFAILLDSCPLEPAERIAKDLLEIVRGFRFVWEEKVFEIGVCIGLVPVTSDSVSAADLMREADAACYAAKNKGRHRIQLYRPNDAELVRREGEQQWAARITEALRENGFRLYQQPIVSLKEGNEDVLRCEVLLRKLEAQRGLILPGAFLPAAERYDLMPAIDRWVVHRVFQSLGRLADREARRYVCSINLSGATLSDDRFLGFVQDELEATGVRADAICFEITETAAIANLHLAIRFIEALRELGCQFALDDFGSGMSSFSYLRTLPVDYLKIAGTFVRQIATNALDRTMVDTINRIGHVMGIETVAEFVENAETIAILRELGVDYAQGYGIAVPAPLSEFLSSLGGNGGAS